MKAQLPGIALLLLTAFFACDPHPDEPSFGLDCLPAGSLQTGVLAFYPFENGNLTDATGNGNDLTNPTTAKPAADRAGNANCAYRFSNRPTATEFLTTTQTAFLNGIKAFSVSLWYQPADSSRESGDYEVLLGRGTGAHCPDRYGEWSVSLYDCRRAVFGHNNSVWANLVTPQTPDSLCYKEIKALTGVWHHVVAVYNNNTYKIYFNGVLQATETGAADCSSNGHVAQDLGDLFLGTFYTGSIDDVLIYNRELSDQEVGALFNAAPCCY
ncbi:MAG: LamG domain-containing protein [Saprospiraceae bacterium]|nr:LamG domain-containing protein [Saprospiraceae bacterium]